MTRVYVSLLPVDGSQKFVYNAGDARVVVSLDRSMKVSDSYSLFMYNSQLMLMGQTATGTDEDCMERAGRTLKAQLHARYVWIPGEYFLLLRTSQGIVLRFDLVLNEHRAFVVKGSRLCKRMSDEDMLSDMLPAKRAMWWRLCQRPGCRQLKAWAVQRAKENAVRAYADSGIDGKLELNSNLLIASRSDLWAHTTALLLKHLGDMEGSLESVNCAELFDPTKNEPYEQLHYMLGDGRTPKSDDLFGRLMESEKKHVFYFYKIQALNDQGGRNLLKAILRQWPGSGNTAIFTGSQQEIDTLMEQNPSISEQFPPENRLAEELYTREEMLTLFCWECEVAKLRLTPEALDRACHMLSDAYRQGVISSWSMSDMRRYVKTVVLPAYVRNTVGRMQQERQDHGLQYVWAEDIDTACLPTGNNALDEVMGRLSQMVGLDNIKENIAALTSQMKFFADRRQLGLPTDNDGSYHALFTGNPGTGKTTVARMLGKVYHALGLLSRGEVVCVDRTRMVGRYIGETEENMKQILQEARGNVLFVDEAYTLYKQDDERDFGRHAVEALLDVLSRRNPDMLIIFAGYQKEMDELMRMNPGLLGRFPYKFRFHDYNAQQLMQIAEALLARSQYLMTDEARMMLSECIAEAAAHRSETFANARWVEQLVRNGIVCAMAERLAATPHTMERSVYQRVEAADVQKAYDRFNPRTVDIRQRRAIGFCA